MAGLYFANGMPVSFDNTAHHLFDGASAEDIMVLQFPFSNAFKLHDVLTRPAMNLLVLMIDVANIHGLPIFFEVVACATPHVPSDDHVNTYKFPVRSPFLSFPHLFFQTIRVWINLAKMPVTKPLVVNDNADDEEAEAEEEAEEAVTMDKFTTFAIASQKEHRNIKMNKRDGTCNTLTSPFIRNIPTLSGEYLYRAFGVHPGPHNPHAFDLHACGLVTTSEQPDAFMAVPDLGINPAQKLQHYIDEQGLFKLPDEALPCVCHLGVARTENPTLWINPAFRNHNQSYVLPTSEAVDLIEYGASMPRTLFEVLVARQNQQPRPLSVFYREAHDMLKVIFDGREGSTINDVESGLFAEHTANEKHCQECEFCRKDWHDRVTHLQRDPHCNSALHFYMLMQTELISLLSYVAHHSTLVIILAANVLRVTSHIDYKRRQPSMWALLFGKQGTGKSVILERLKLLIPNLLIFEQDAETDASMRTGKNLLPMVVIHSSHFKVFIVDDAAKDTRNVMYSKIIATKFSLSTSKSVTDDRGTNTMVRLIVVLRVGRVEASNYPKTDAAESDRYSFFWVRPFSLNNQNEPDPSRITAGYSEPANGTLHTKCWKIQANRIMLNAAVSQFFCELIITTPASTSAILLCMYDIMAKERRENAAHNLRENSAVRGAACSLAQAARSALTFTSYIADTADGVSLDEQEFRKHIFQGAAVVSPTNYFVAYTAMVEESGMTAQDVVLDMLVRHVKVDSTGCPTVVDGYVVTDIRRRTLLAGLKDDSVPNAPKIVEQLYKEGTIKDGSTELKLFIAEHAYNSTYCKCEEELIVDLYKYVERNNLMNQPRNIVYKDKEWSVIPQELRAEFRAERGLTDVTSNPQVGQDALGDMMEFLIATTSNKVAWRKHARRSGLLSTVFTDTKFNKTNMPGSDGVYICLKALRDYHNPCRLPEAMRDFKHPQFPDQCRPTKEYPEGCVVLPLGGSSLPNYVTLSPDSANHRLGTVCCSTPMTFIARIKPNPLPNALPAPDSPATFVSWMSADLVEFNRIFVALARKSVSFVGLINRYLFDATVEAYLVGFDKSRPRVFPAPEPVHLSQFYKDGTLSECHYAFMSLASFAFYLQSVPEACHRVPVLQSFYVMMRQQQPRTVDRIAKTCLDAFDFEEHVLPGFQPAFLQQVAASLKQI